MSNLPRFRDFLMEEEACRLEPYAAKNSDTCLIGRSIPEDPDPMRLPFQRDRDRILHSRAFRRLMHKTQVFIANKGDHYRNRLTHTLEVSQISRSIAKALGLNEELTEAIALGHDLGHTPFGHAGENTLHKIISGQGFLDDRDIKIGNYGGFKHNFQSLHIIDNLEQVNDGAGMNLSLAVREGILKHTGRQIKVTIRDRSKGKIVKEKQSVDYPTLDLIGIDINRPSFTLEGQVVAVADEIAQCTHDLEDGIRAGILTIHDIHQATLLDYCFDSMEDKVNTIASLENKSAAIIRNLLIRKLINMLVHSTIRASIKNIGAKISGKSYFRYDVFEDPIIDLEAEIKNSMESFYDLITNIVINSDELSASDSKAAYIIEKLFKAYYIHPQQLPTYMLEKYFFRKGIKIERKEIESLLFELWESPDFIRLICDHISGMTDQYASREYAKLYNPDFL